MMNGKTVLITGATFGIGKQTALGLAKLGAEVVLVGRDPERTKATVEWIKNESGNSKIDFLLADLFSQKEVRRLASEFKKKYKHLDVLINNAGGIFTKREVTVDGFEKTWALNHLAYFTLTLELLDLLKASGASRIINVASDAHRQGKMKFEDLQSEKQFGMLQPYGQSKLANILFTYALARRLKDTKVTVNCLHPGVVASGFGQEKNGILKFLLLAIRPFMINSDKGASTSIYLASSPEVSGVSGKYFSKSKIASSSKASLNQADQERLWEISLKQAGFENEKKLKDLQQTESVPV